MSVVEGKRFGRLLVLHRASRAKYWVCRCDCGVTKEVYHGNLGPVKSCGCWKSDRWKALWTTHGEARPNKRTVEYRAWASMMQRCHNPRSRLYRNYGGRGIHVCPAWRRSFSRFLDHVGRRPSSSHSLGRINNDKGYSPTNVRWETLAEQSYNKRGTLRATIDGTTRTVARWSEIFGIPYYRIQQRLRAGWSPKAAVMRPIMNKGFHVLKKAR